MTARRAGWRTVARLALALGLALAVGPRPALAAGVSATQLSLAAAAPSERAPLELWVNGARSGTVSVVLRGADVLAPVEELEFAGLRGFGGARETIDGRVHVSLASLAPAVEFVVDEVDLALKLTATAGALGRSRVDLRPLARPPGLEVRGDPSAFANYAVQHTTGGDTSGSLEVGASAAGGLLYGSGQLLQDGAAVRGLTSLTLDAPAALRRTVLGDAFATSSGLGGGLLLAGVSVSREDALDPYRLRSALPHVSGFARSPSTLEIYVNGVLRRELQLPPGTYDVSNLPVVAGAGNVQTVLRDAYGRAEVVRWDYYFTPTLLARGESDYGYALGFRRHRFGRASFEYGPPVLVARHRAGVADVVTLGARLDAAEGLVSAGPTATFGLPFGTLDLEAAASVDAGTAGAAAAVGYGFSAPWFGAGTLLRVLGDRYANATLGARDDRARLQWTTFAGAPVGSRVSLGLTHTLTRARDAEPYDAVSLRADVLVARDVVLGLSGSRTRSGGAAGFDVFATLSWAFAPLSVADVAGQAGRGGRGAQAGVQRGLPVGTGLGYRARAATTPASDDVNLLGQAQWEHGRYELQYDRSGTQELGMASAMGGVVLVGGRPFLTRPVQDGFALARVGVPGVRVYAEGQEVGRTDGRGDLLVPTVLPYYGNRVGIADRDIPVEFDVGATEQLAAPRYRGGVVARFPVARLRAVQGTLAVDGGAPPAFGDLTVRVEGSAAGAGRMFVASPVGRDGRFFLQGLPAGEHPGLVDWSGGRCSVTIVVPAEPAVVDVGTVPCAGERQPAEPDALPPPPPPEQEQEQAQEPRTDPSTSGSTIEPSAATAQPTGPDPEAASSTAMPPRPAGYGPRTGRCPSCAACFSAALGRTATPTALARCADDLTAMTPGLDGRSAEAACAAYDGWDAFCAECLGVRAERGCPAWPPGE